MRSQILQITFFFVIALGSPSSWADGQYVDIFPKSIDEIQQVLNTLDNNLDAVPEDENLEPILMMLHGPEAARFLRTNYSANQAIVDQTAKLSGYGIIEVKICETWMRKNRYSQDQLFNFVSTVAYGAAELKRLEQDEGYTEYTFDL